jgi:hypothetical protein
MFIWLSTLHWPILQHTLVAGFAMLYVLGLALFVNIHPILATADCPLTTDH